MIFRQLFDRVSCTYTYLLASKSGKEALLIDPVREDVPKYLKLLKELDLKLVVALDTHCHADHITGTGDLRESTECAIVMGENCKTECLSYKVKEGEKITVGGVCLKALFTPGHTDDSYSYHVGDRVFTGDVLLIRGTGRTDFQCGDARQSYDSIFNKLLKLSSETFVFPAHDYKGMPYSTIGEEVRYNPRLQVRSIDEYVKIMNNLNLPCPKMMDVAIPANLKCGKI